MGRTFVVTGLLLLAFAAYQLWGTGLQTARAQGALEDDFAERVAAAGATTATVAPTTTVPTSTTRGTAVTSAPTTTTTPAPPATLPPVATGDPVGRVEIPRIGVDDIVVAGVRVADLRKGPGHYPTTPLPGQEGNVAIAGHRTTYGAPFNRVDELAAGDEIIVTDLLGRRFRYLVERVWVVKPSDVSVLAQTPGRAELTLTSCHPKYSARERIIVRAVLDPGTSAAPAPAAPPAVPTPDGGGGGGDGGQTSTPGDPGTDPADALDDPLLTAGWFHDRSAIAPTLLGGALCTAIAVGARLGMRRVGGRGTKVGLALAGTLVFAPALFVTFEHLSRLLPQGI